MKLVQAVALMKKISRRDASELIKQGKVTVNGQIAESYSQTINPNSDQIKVNNQKSSKKLLVNKKYFAFYKPRGVECTLVDKANTLKKFIEQIHVPNLKPIGRLDVESEGLMILTNDGDFINQVSHPKSHVSKVYKVTLSGYKDEKQLQNLEKNLEIVSQKIMSGRIELLVKLSEGKNRQIRRACAQSGLFVERILRISIGKVKLENIQPKLKAGSWQDLKSKPFTL